MDIEVTTVNRMVYFPNPLGDDLIPQTDWLLTGYGQSTHTAEANKVWIERDNTADGPCPDDDDDSDGGGDSGSDPNSWGGFLGEFMDGLYADCITFPTEPGGPLSGIAVHQFNSESDALDFALASQTNGATVFVGTAQDPISITPADIPGQVPQQPTPGGDLSCAEVWAIYQNLVWAGAEPTPEPIVTVPGTVTTVVGSPATGSGGVTVVEQPIYVVVVLAPSPTAP